MTMQHDPGALDDQMDVAPSPNELFELPKQIAMKVKTTGAGSAWHTLSIDLALRLFPKPGSNFGPSVLGMSACGGGRGIDLPAVESGQSAHFRYYARAADRVPAGVLDLLEWHWSTMSSFFGLDPGLVTYYLFDSQDDLTRNGPCGATACESAGSVYTAACAGPS